MKKTLVLIFTVFLVLIACIGFSFAFESPDNPPVYLSVLSGDKIQKIECWQNENGECFFFVPSFAESSDIKIHLNTTNEVRISDKKITNGMDCANFEFNTEYEIIYSSFAGEKTKKLTFLKSKNIPAMFIETESGNMDYIHEKKGNKETGFMTLVSDNGDINYFGGLDSIKGRGNNTWENFDKKPYFVKLTNETNLLGMGDGINWVLIANADDYSNMRNKLVYDFSKAVGFSFSPDSRWIDLYLNGEYVGLYLLTENIEVNENRVELDEDGVLVSIEQEYKLKQDGTPFIKTDTGVFFEIHYPLTVDSSQKKEFEAVIQTVENSLLKEENSESEYLEYIDLDSFAKKFLIEEMFGNLDGFLASSFFYTIEGKIYAGPVWDYDKALGNDNDQSWSIVDPNVFVLKRYFQNKSYNVFWLESLYNKKEFKDELLQIFKNEYYEKSKLFFKEKISEYENIIKDAAYVNSLRWMIGQEYNLTNELKQIYDYVESHTNYLYDIWINKKSYCNIYFSGIENDNFASVIYGDKLKYLPKSNDTQFSVFKGWYYKETDEPFDITKPITEDIEIYAKWEKSRQNKIDDVFKLIPIVFISILFIVFLVIEFRRIRNGGGGI